MLLLGFEFSSAWARKDNEKEMMDWKLPETKVRQREGKERESETGQKGESVMRIRERRNLEEGR